MQRVSSKEAQDLSGERTTDGSREATIAAEAAAELAKGIGSELHVVHVVSTAQEMLYAHPLAKKRSEALLEARKLRGLTLLDKRVTWIESIGGKVAGSYYREGKAEDEIIRLGEELEAGLVTTGGRKLGWFERAFADNLSGRLLRRANRPVMVVREPAAQNNKRRHQTCVDNHGREDGLVAVLPRCSDVYRPANAAPLSVGNPASIQSCLPSS